MKNNKTTTNTGAIPKKQSNLSTIRKGPIEQPTWQRVWILILRILTNKKK